MGESVYPTWKGADASCPRHQMSRVLQKDAEQESQMRAEIQDMKQELSTVNMMDEFARYARLERKINKMTDKLKTHGTSDDGRGGHMGIVQKEELKANPERVRSRGHHVPQKASIRVSLKVLRIRSS